MKDPSQAPELKRFVLPALFVGALFVALFMRRPEVSHDARELVLQGATMGTRYKVKVVIPPLDNLAQSEIDGAVNGALERVNKGMSTYIKDSELSRFNDQRTLEPFPASEELRFVITEAKRISELSGGAFDITVGPLVDAWGFGPDQSDTSPDSDEIQFLKERVGYDKVVVGEHNLSKTNADVRCDLSAIAKGYAVDQVAAALEKLGYKNFMAEVGGEVITRGHRIDGHTWRIGIEKPDTEEFAVHRAIALNNRAMASSGDYRNYREIAGKRISHTIDPRSGKPIEHRLASVTVIHEKCITADALATALSVLGYKEGKALAEKHNLAAFFLVRTKDGGFQEHSTAAFEVLVKVEEPAPKAP